MFLQHLLDLNIEIFNASEICFCAKCEVVFFLQMDSQLSQYHSLNLFSYFLNFYFTEMKENPKAEEPEIIEITNVPQESNPENDIYSYVLF